MVRKRAIQPYPFASVRAGGAAYPNINVVDGTIRERYRVSGYNQSATTVDGKDTSFGIEAGVRVALTQRLSTEVSYERASFGGGVVDTNGTRTLGDLNFRMNTAFDASTHSANVAVPVQVVQDWGLEVAPLVKFNWWTLEQEIVDARLAGGRQVRGGTTNGTREGSDVSYGAKVRLVPAERYVVEFSFERLVLNGAFDPDGPAAWLEDVSHNRFSGGVTVFPFGRGGW